MAFKQISLEKKTILICVLSLSMVLGLYNAFSVNKEFTLYLNGFGPDIKGISVQFENSEINFVNPEYNEFGSNKYALSFKTPTRSGSLDLSVTMLNEETYSIQNMEFRNGEFNYVYKIKDKIGYTTGHW